MARFSMAMTSSQAGFVSTIVSAMSWSRCGYARSRAATRAFSLELRCGLARGSSALSAGAGGGESGARHVDASESSIIEVL
eukprot:2169298-Pleurochrysis_carterae.AAC.1